MVQDGPRLKKLKEVYKKAIQETLKIKENIIMDSELKDSFYSNSSVQIKQEEIVKIFNDLKHVFSEVFKNKIHENGLDTKLNILDNYIKSNRISCQNIKDEKYIRDIFLSYTVDKKEEVVKVLENNEKEIELTIEKYKNDIDSMMKDLEESKKENIEYEKNYNLLVNEMQKAVSNDEI